MKKLFSLFAAFLFVGSMWGTDTEASLTLSSSKKFGTTSGSTLTDTEGNTWTCVGSDISNQYQSTYSGQQFGTSKTNNTYTFTCTIPGATITSVSATMAAGNSTPTYAISVGGSSKKSGSLSSTSTKYTTGTISATGEICITMDQNSGGKAVYLGKIEISYVESDCTAPTTALSITSANTVTLGNTLSLTSNGGNGGAIVWSVVNGTGSATLEGTTLTPVSKGTVTVTATQAENTVSSTTYCGAAPTQTITISKPVPSPIAGGMVDQLQVSTLGVGDGGYAAFTNKQASNSGHSDAVYAGTVARNGKAAQYNIQLNSGTTNEKLREIATSTSGGFAKRVYVTWATQSDNTNGRKLTVYGSHDAYTGSETEATGTEIGDIVFSTGDAFEYLDIAADYEYIQIVANNAIYMDQIDITWIPATYAITFNATPDNGTLTIYDEDTNPIGTGTKFEEGAQFIVETQPASGYKLNTLTVVETDDPTNDVTSTVLENGILTLPAYGVTVAATFTSATGIEEVESSVKSVKFIENGQLFIEQNGHTYNAMGQLVK